jgi:hypothetical protein
MRLSMLTVRRTKASRLLLLSLPPTSRTPSRTRQRAFEQLVGVKSVEQAIDIQSRYAKKAYDEYIAEVSKLGEMYVSLARSAYKPFETALAKKVA